MIYNLFDGCHLEIGLGLKGVAQGVWRGRMLQLQTPNPPQTFNHHPNIRSPTSAANPRQVQSGRVQRRALHSFRFDDDVAFLEHHVIFMF